MPPSPETSAALEAEFAERDIALIAGRRVSALDPRAQRRDARRRHRAAVRPLPRRAEAPRPRRGHRQRHDRGRLRAGRLGDARDALPRRVRGRRRRHGRRAEGRRVRRGRRAHRRPGADRRAAAAASAPGRHLGRGTCYIEFGDGRVGSVDIDFLSGPTRTGTFNAPSAALVAEKERFGSSRRARWFGS